MEEALQERVRWARIAVSVMARLGDGFNVVGPIGGNEEWRPNHATKMLGHLSADDLQNREFALPAETDVPTRGDIGRAATPLIATGRGRPASRDALQCSARL